MNKHLWIKISVPILIFFAVVLIIFIVFLNVFVSKNQSILVKNKIDTQIAEFNHYLKNIEIKALSIASFCASGDFVQKAYNN